MTLTIGSMFTGIGGFDLAGEWMGWKTLWMIENRRFPRRVLRRRFPDAELHGDARKVNYRKLQRPDILCAGFPCQRHSSAIHNDLRTAHEQEDFLWPVVAHAIRKTKPTYVVVENVPNIIRDGTLAIILRDLAALRYDAEWDVIPAALVGAPHIRTRAFVVAYPRGFGIERYLPRKRSRQTAEGWEDCESPLHEFADAPFTERGSIPQPLIRRVDDGFANRVDRLKAIGNAVVPQVVYEFPFRIINEIERQRHAI